MFGGGGLAKLGRGGGTGRGGGKRALPPSAPPRARARPPAGGSAGRGGRPGQGGGAAPPAREEAFRLVPGGSLDFAAIIRLTPDLVEEIRRAEAQGRAARIKFDSNPNNTSGNVIDVGGKEFRFDWSRELGDLCDIYEERQNVEDGDGLLVECGSAWRKLNVHRILDESTKNHVKMRSEEAERLLKSRKAIVLDPANPSVKNQARAMVAAAVEGRMGWKQKKEFFKKRKAEQSSGPSIVRPKSVLKAGPSSNNITKANPSGSPLPSPPEQSKPGTSSSPLGTFNILKDSISLEEIVAPSNTTKEENGNFRKEIPTGVAHGTVSEEMANKRNIVDQKSNLRSLLITVLSENPKGMSLKSIEKAVGGTIPNAGKNIENLIKNIATFQAPGRYILKPGLEVESSRRQASESASSPESGHDQFGSAQPILERGANENIEQQTHFSPKIEESDPFDLFGEIQHSPNPDNIGKKVSNESEKRGYTSSESGSGSDSESDSSDSGSDSGSQSRSRSKSRSPAGSASASSSDSESENTSSSKEGSDVDVDIMTSDDGKEENEVKADGADSKISPSPSKWRPNDCEPEDNIDIEGDEDDCGAEQNIDIEGDEDDGEPERNIDIEGDQDAHPTTVPLDLNDGDVGDEMVLEVEMSEPPGTNTFKASENFKTEIARSPEVEEAASSPDKHKKSERQESYTRNAANDTNDWIKDSRVAEPQMRMNKLGTKQIDITGKNSKAKFKRAYVREEFIGDKTNSKRSKFAGSAETIYPEKSKDSAIMEDLHNTNPDNSHNFQTSSNAKSNANTDINMQNQSLPTPGRSKAYGNAHKMQRGPNFQSAASFDAKQLGHRKRKGVDNVDKSARYMENLGRGNKPVEAVHFQPDEGDTSTINGKSGESKDTGQALPFQRSDVETPPVAVGKKSVLRRELSDLELGEFREPFTGEEAVGVKRSYERKSSFKSSDNKLPIPDSLNLDISKGRTAANSTDSKKQSPYNVTGGINGKHHGFNQRIADNYVNSSQPQQKPLASQNQPFLKVHTDSELVSHFDKATEISGENERNANGNVGQDKAKNYHKELKPRKMNSMRDSANQKNNNLWMQSNRRESSSDEDSFFDSKFEKDKPELKGPIEDYKQYKEYVQEYREKYDHYCSLNKNLENLRNDFLKLGRDLELAKGRDSHEYYTISEHLKEMYHQHGEKHKQMKKVFIVLHEELEHLKQRIKDFAQTYTKE